MSSDSTERRKRLHGVRVLVADDDDRVRMIAEALLGEEGASVTCVVNGAAAVAMCLGAALEFDAVLMDVEMPIMGGLEAAALIRRRRSAAELSIIGQSSRTTPADRERALAAGMNDYLGKPFDVDKVVDAFLRHHHGRSD